MIRSLLENQINLKKTAVIESGKEITYSELLKNARRIQCNLPHNAEKNIAIFLADGNGYISALWAALMSGFTALPINIRLTPLEILPLLKSATVGTIITSTQYRHIFTKYKAVLSLNIICIDELSIDTKFSRDGQTAQYHPTNKNIDKPILLLNTSGTTGKPKLVPLTEKNIQTSVLGYLDKLVTNNSDLPDSRILLCAPFTSVYGMMVICACFLRSFTLIILDSGFTPDALYRAAEKYKATHYEGSASAILLMEKTAGRTIPYDISTLKFFGFGGSKVSGQSIRNVIKAYPDKDFCQGYGMTEAAPLIAKHPVMRADKAESVGTAIKGVSIAVDSGNGINSAPYAKGEIVVCGNNVMQGYLKNKSETDKVLKNGWLYTGDIGYLDDEGYLFICGRNKNIIIVRGFNVYPEEVESCILSISLVKDCFVYGQTDGYGNETVCADVIAASPSINADEIIAYCKTHLADYKIPKQITFCQSIQKNISGKTRRHKK